jgi:hypothetical protein
MSAVARIALAVFACGLVWIGAGSAADNGTAFCPNPEGQQCLGKLKPGTYKTVVFEPTLTYTVPAGWTNFEDTPGNFLLVPRRGDLPGVNAGTSDFIGVYTSVAAEARSCTSQAAVGIAAHPEAIARWIRRQDGLISKPPRPVVIGGLKGVSIDVVLAKGAGLHCPGYAPAYFPILIGLSPSSLDHGLIPGLTWRLYLLAFRDGTLAIEVNDLAHGKHLAEYTTLVKRLRFASR